MRESAALDAVLVRVSPGHTVTLSPHPSGLPLPPLVLAFGATLKVSPEDAERLFQSGRILHPVTGEIKPADPPPARRGPTIQLGAGPARDMAGAISSGALQAAEQAAVAAYQAKQAVPPLQRSPHEERHADVRISYGTINPTGPISGVDF